ncbi:hypothetical protein FWC31_01720 [Candidatus Saccharibacteria bacterium]|nr:hypothetical protein [Candidatus Saccharibacteria bacterium]
MTNEMNIYTHPYCKSSCKKGMEDRCPLIDPDRRSEIYDRTATIAYQMTMSENPSGDVEGAVSQAVRDKEISMIVEVDRCGQAGLRHERNHKRREKRATKENRGDGYQWIPY